MVRKIIENQLLQYMFKKKSNKQLTYSDHHDQDLCVLEIENVERTNVERNYIYTNPNPTNPKLSILIEYYF